MPSLPPAASVPAAQVGAEVAPAGRRTTVPAGSELDFAELLSAQLGAGSAAAALAPALLAADQAKAPEAPLQKPPVLRDQASPVAPDAAAVILALAGAQPQPPEPMPSPGSPVLPADPEAVRTGIPDKQARLVPVLGRMPAAAASTAEEPGARPEMDPEPVALGAQATVAAGTRQTLPEVHAGATAVQDTEVADTQNPQVAATPPAPPAAVAPEARVAPPAAHAPEVAARLGTPGFADDFGNRVVWMAGQGQHAAEFRIDPPHLGPVEVRLALSNDQASLVLLSPHASVREALQSTLPRLQELLGAAGINLGSVHVGTQGSGQRGQNGDPALLRSERSNAAGIEPHHALSPATGWWVRATGVVDTYA